MWIVVYRPHNVFNCHTQYIGPFTDYMAAEDALCALGALGTYVEDGVLNNPGVKFIEDLVRTPQQALQFFTEVDADGCLR